MDVPSRNHILSRPAMIQRVYGLSPQPEDFHRMIERHRSSALVGYIHEKQFHLTRIATPEAIPPYADRFLERRESRYCTSCGKRMPHPPLCTGCLLYL